MKSLTTLLILAFTIILIMPSCFRFRMTDHRKTKKMEPSGIAISFGDWEHEGNHIHYTQSGDHRKPCVILVHGSPGSSSQFLSFHQDSMLNARFNVITIDRQGFGFSNFGSGEPSLDQQAKNLNALIQSLSVDSCVLVGHSYGGPLVVRSAMLSTNQTVKGIIVVSGSVSAELEPHEPWRKTVNRKAIRWMMPATMRVSNDEILELKSGLKSMEDDWINIDQPVTIIHGKKDKLVTAENVDFMQQKLTNSKRVKSYVYPELNHFIPFQQPELVKNAIFELYDY